MKQLNRKIWFLLVLFIAMLMPVQAALAAPKNVVHLYFFNGDGCQHCAHEKVFLAEMQEKYGEQFVVHDHEVWYHEENGKVFEEFAKAFDFEPSGIPVTFIGDQYFVGFGENTKKSIRTAIEDGIENGVVDTIQIVNGETPVVATIDGSAAGTTIDVPFFGTVDLANKSLIVSTILIGIVDGVNPCSLWVLTMLLAMIVRTASRKKTLIIGTIFLTVTSFIYALFIGGVFTILSYVSFMRWIQVGVACLTLIMGFINLKDYFFFKEGVSLTIDDKHKPGIYQKMRNVMNHSDDLWAMISATVLLAVGVSLVEFSCTAAFPVVWSNLLVSAGASRLEFILLLILYMLLYQLDEMVIFLVAVYTMRSNRMQEKHGQLLKLFSGCLMVILSAVMIINPAWMNELTNTLLIFLIAVAVTLLVYVLAEKVLPRYGIFIGHNRPKKDKKKKKES